ncbi:sodium-dependent bicarbonate transport family permease [Flavobacterium nackdongense]|uniref:Sodium-dependent bicarbonate transport family permease n=1 Tax=Flavobacterium nackdongense TaxID=2547394 RepID=A0A4P6YDB7_9FLAO|nr:sodium-dependent bicarbonate transport family permease [Flavobacterium nackdongense]QBN18363.1 sodium-dependent bicarbonate transport family permease [Flavobacterium nackdongense]
MNTDLLMDNLTSPALLFFLLGIIAVQVKSDLEIPENTSKFISLYLLFSIGFKGGQELAHSSFTLDIIWGVVFGIAISIIIPFYSFFILKKKLGPYNAGAIAAAYGSVSAVTFVTAISFLEVQNLEFNGYMVAIMALMEAPAIIIGVILISFYKKDNALRIGGIIKHSFTNGSVLLIMGSLIIGMLASDSQAAGIKPFTTDIFKGFLVLFLLDMGMTSGRKLSAFIKNGWFTIAFALLIPLINGCLVAVLSGFVTQETGDRFIFAILAASASYIAVPAAMKIAAPKANPGLYLPMALAVTFPFNITLGFPVYFAVILST